MIRWAWALALLLACGPAPTIMVEKSDMPAITAPAEPPPAIDASAVPTPQADASPGVNDAGTVADVLVPEADSAPPPPVDAGPPPPSVACGKLPNWTPVYTEIYTAPPTFTGPAFDHIEWKDPPGALDFRTGAGVCVRGAACRIYFGLAGPYSAGVCQ